MNQQLECPHDPYLQEDLERIAACPIAWERLNHRTVLITGATGLIGRQLVLAILAANRILGYSIRIIALVRSMEKAYQSFRNLMHRNELNIIIGDVTRPICLDRPVDYIIHAASITSSKDFVTAPVNVIEVSLNGTKNLLEAAKEQKCKSVVFLSSM